MIIPLLRTWLGKSTPMENELDEFSNTSQYSDMTQTNLYLHIGTWKTGTTSIQEVLFQNRDKLLGSSILYPISGMSKERGHHIFPWAISGTSPSAEYDDLGRPSKEDLRKNLATEISTNKNKSVIISSEGFYQIDFQKMYDFFRDFRITIIVYIRRQDEHIESAYKQMVKGHRRLTISFTEYFNELKANNFKSYDHLPRLQNLKNLFGTENLIVRPYGKKYFIGRNVVTDFLGHLRGHNFSELDFTGAQSGHTPSNNAIECTRLLNKYGVSEHSKKNLYKRMNEFFHDSNSTESTFMSSQEKHEVMQHLVDSNAEITRKFLQGYEDFFALPTKNSSQLYEGLDKEKLKQMIADSVDAYLK